MRWVFLSKSEVKSVEKFTEKSLVYAMMSIVLLLTSIPFNAVAATNCPSPAEYSSLAKEYIEYYNIPLEDSKGRALNEKFLLNQSNIGSNVIVYGWPSDIDSKIKDLKKGQYRYLGWDYEGTPDAAKWMTEMIDPYGPSKTFLESYNKLKGTNWTGDTLLDYTIIQQARTKFSPGVVQMWNIWQPDGSWWYKIFTIPAEPLPSPPSKPDLIISDLIAPADAWVGDSVPIKITTKNQGGAFTVGIVGTSIKSEVISNVPPGQIKTITECILYYKWY